MLSPRKLKNKAINKVDEYIPFGYNLGDFSSLLKTDDEEQAPAADGSERLYIRLKVPEEVLNGDKDGASMLPSPDSTLNSPLGHEILDTLKLESGLNLLHVATTNKAIQANPRDQRRFIALAIAQILQAVQDLETVKGAVVSLDSDVKYEIMRDLLADLNVVGEYIADQKSYAKAQKAKKEESEKSPLLKLALDYHPIGNLVRLQQAADQRRADREATTKPKGKKGKKFAGHEAMFWLLTWFRMSAVIGFLAFKYFMEPFWHIFWTIADHFSAVGLIRLFTRLFLSATLFFLSLLLKFVSLLAPGKHSSRHRARVNGHRKRPADVKVPASSSFWSTSTPTRHSSSAESAARDMIFDRFFESLRT